MPRKYIESLTPVPKALEMLKKKVRRIGETINLPLWDAQGLVLAEDIVSPENIPPHPKGAYDGYAVRSIDTPGKLKIVGRVTIGSLPSFHLGRGEAAYVTTGSYIPEGADAVIPEEEVQVEGEYIIINSKVEAGAYIDQAGAYSKKGSILLGKGRILTSYDIIGLLDAGITAATVYRPIRLGIIETGNELFKPSTPERTSEKIRKGMVVATTGDFVAWFSTEYLTFTRIVDIVMLPDNLDAVSWYVDRLLDNVDIVLITGGTGPSDIDLFHMLPEKLGGELLFRGLHVIGGKPTSAMIVDGKPVIGLSGYPTSALHVFVRLVYPLISYMSNLDVQPMIPIVKAILEKPMKIKRPRPIKATLSLKQGKLYATPLEHSLQKSSALVAMTMSDGLILAEEGVHDPGEEVLVLAYRVPKGYYYPSINF